MGYKLEVMRVTAEKAGFKVTPIEGVSGIIIGYAITKGSRSRRFRSSSDAIDWMKQRR